MKKIIILLSLLSISSILWGQNQKELARFYITHAVNNGHDTTKQIVSWGLYTVFYTIDGVLYMANVAENHGTQSYGEVYNMRHEVLPETNTQYRMDIFYFNWSYANDYDSGEGTCAVEFSKVYKPQGTVSYLKMVTEDLEVIEYTGYMEGTLNF